MIMKSYQSIIAPVLTEKSVYGEKNNKYMMYIKKDINKIELAQFLHQTFGVTVKNINRVKNAAKTKTGGRGKKIIKRPQITKAIVTLKKGQTIDFSKMKDLK